MLIAEAQDVARAYPYIPQEAVDHLLAALHRAVPVLENGDMAEGLRMLREELARYPGPLDDFERLGVRAIFAAAGRGRHPLANQLGDLRLLAPSAVVPRYVVVGDAMTARMWARNRGIGQNQVVAVRRARDEVKLRGLDPRTGRGVIIIYLSADDPVPGELAKRLAILVDAGAAVRDEQWRPGDRPDPDKGRPRLILTPPR